MNPPLVLTFSLPYPHNGYLIEYSTYDNRKLTACCDHLPSDPHHEDPHHDWLIHTDP